MKTDNSVITTAVMQSVMGMIRDTICCAPHFNISRLLAALSSSEISSESSSSSNDGRSFKHSLNSQTRPQDVLSSSSALLLCLLRGLTSVSLHNKIYSL